MAENNNSFVFYRSFYDAMQLLDNDDKSDFMRLICELAFNGVEADFTNGAYSDLVKVAYTISAEQIKASIRNRENGAKGGTQKGLNNKNRGVNTPLLNENTPLNTNVNEKVNDKVKENDYVNIDTHNIHNFLDTKEYLKNIVVEEFGFNLDEAGLIGITNKLVNFDDPQKEIKGRVNYIKEKYGKCEPAEKKALFYKSFDWDIDNTQKPKEKKTKKDSYNGAPKVCTFCGSKLIKYAGVPGVVLCPSCNDAGNKTFWELEHGIWKCNRN